MKTLTFIFSLSSFHSLTQIEKENLILKNDPINNIKLELLSKLQIENISMIRICNADYRFDCKGFINEIDTMTFNSEKINIRAEIEKNTNDQYLIKYKYRESNEFIINSFQIICYNNSLCLAVPNRLSPAELNDEYFLSNFSPSSSDERDVVYIKSIGTKIILYTKID